MGHVRAKALSEYREIIRNAFREFVNLRILHRLDIPAKDNVREKSILIEAQIADLAAKPDYVISPPELELQVFQHLRRRLSFLVKEDSLFDEIEKLNRENIRENLLYSLSASARAGCSISLKGEKVYFRLRTRRRWHSFTNSLSEIDKRLSASFTKSIAGPDPSVKKLQVAKVA